MRHLRTIRTFTSVVAAVALGQIPGATAPRMGQAEQEVRTMIQQYRQAMVRRDLTALERIWSDDYTFTNPQGRLLSRKERLANLRSGATRLTSIESERDAQVRVHGNTAVATSRVALVARYSGQENDGDYRNLGVWVKRDGRWQLVANQITRIAPQTAR